MKSTWVSAVRASVKSLAFSSNFRYTGGIES
jgi:hypothetical protein